jgi:hypothetical protein
MQVFLRVHWGRGESLMVNLGAWAVFSGLRLCRGCPLREGGFCGIWSEEVQRVVMGHFIMPSIANSAGEAHARFRSARHEEQTRQSRVILVRCFPVLYVFILYPTTT